MMTTGRSKADGVFKVKLINVPQQTHLRGYISQGGRGDPGHAVNMSVARSCGFYLFLYRAWRGEDVLIGLRTME
jgi:hypothetical protein